MLLALKTLARVSRGWIQNHLDQPMLSSDLFSEELGKSVQGRSIECVSLGKGEPSVLVFSCIHGNEVGSRKTAIELLNWLQGQTMLLSKLTVHVIPVLNPDGLALAKTQPDYAHGGTIGRFNGHDVDLNRHFPVPSFQSRARWNRGANYRGEAKDVFAGEQPGSEPEYQAFRAAVQRFKPVLVIALHNVGKDVMPNQLPVAQAAAKTFAQATDFEFFSEELWKELAQTGTACEWFEQEQIPYIEIELPSRWKSCWPLVRLGFEAILKQVGD